jgi:hypothetical protein
MQNRIQLATVLALIAACSLAAAIPAGADILYFSSEASDDDAPVSVFRAQVDYGFDSTSGALTLLIQNQTDAPSPYTISSFYFTVSSDVTDLIIQDNGGFTGASLTSPDHAGGFGWFDYGLDFGAGNTGLTSGDSVTVELTATGANLGIDDFFARGSWGGGLTDAVAAMHFTRGPGDDSAFTIPASGDVHTPEPATLVMMGVGLVMTVAGRKSLRRHRR